MTIHHSEILGVVLAGGQNRRMGKRPKWLLPIDEKPMIEHILTRFEPQVSQVILNGSANELQKYAYDIVSDPIAGFQGPLVGLLAGMEYANNHGFPWVASCPCDTPFLPTHVIRTLSEAITEKQQLCCIASSHGRTHPTFGLWSVKLLPILRHTLLHSDLRSISVWAGQLETPALTVNFSTDTTYDTNAFTNINTPEDWLTAQSTLLNQ